MKFSRAFRGPDGDRVPSRTWTICSFLGSAGPFAPPILRQRLLRYLMSRSTRNFQGHGLYEFGSHSLCRLSRSSMPSRTGIVGTSFDFSSIATCPRVSWLSRALALTSEMERRRSLLRLTAHCHDAQAWCALESSSDDPHTASPEVHRAAPVLADIDEGSFATPGSAISTALGGTSASSARMRTVRATTTSTARPAKWVARPQGMRPPNRASPRRASAASRRRRWTASSSSAPRTSRIASKHSATSSRPSVSPRGWPRSSQGTDGCTKAHECLQFAQAHPRWGS